MQKVEQSFYLTGMSFEERGGSAVECLTRVEGLCV